MTLPCDCSLAGWCERHAQLKNIQEVELCQNDPVQRRSDDNAAPERRKGLIGTELTRLFESAGVTKERYVAFKEFLGMRPKCDCPERAAYLDKLHALAKKWAS